MGNEEPMEERPFGGIPVVAIGASAGGLEAFTEVLQGLPVDTGFAFVMIQHLDPNHDSALTQLLSRTTTMPVVEVKSDMQVEPNHVYVIAPKSRLTIQRGLLMIGERDGRVPERIIDGFFESLGHDQREGAIGIVLSGTGTDGALGLQAIKAEGGITFAQDQSAKYDGMPLSAIKAGCVDFVLSPERMGAELDRIAKHPILWDRDRTVHGKEDRGNPGKKHSGVGERAAHQTGSTQINADSESLEQARREACKTILVLLRNHCGVDFSLYRSLTVERRIARRTVLTKKNTLQEYAAALKGDSAELDALYSDVLINVTSFFRNPDAFESLKKIVFPKLLDGRSRDDSVRVWTPGCSTGQEPYSIAMTFAEFCDALPVAPKLQIFATDLNEDVLLKARQSLYPKAIAEELSPERLRRFFVEEEDGYRISKALREQVVFARQNVLSDPPFSRVDLISCRNLLIYFEAELQKIVMPAFHYALKPGGFLFLGASESVGQFTELFASADKKHRIFTKKAVATPNGFQRVVSDRTTRPWPDHINAPAANVDRGPPDGIPAELSAQREADRISINEFAPPGVLVNAEMQVLQFRGTTSDYLEPPSGKPSFDVLKMARKGLMLPLRAALLKAKGENVRVRRDGVQVHDGNESRLVNLLVIPLKNLNKPYYLVLFQPAGEIRLTREFPQAPRSRSKKTEPGRITDLEHELDEVRDYLQSVQEQNETVNAQLQASSEEILATNAELQSINEELETSKEELQSSNEELTTLNEEVANRNTELNQLNADLSNFQVSIQTAIVLLGRDLTLRRFTPVAEKMFNLLPTDVGRPLRGVRHNLEFPGLESFLTEVMDTVSVEEREVRDRDGRWYLLRARPYLTLENVVDGVVLVLVDIAALKRSEQEIRVARDYAQAILRSTHDALIVLNADLRVETANEAFYEIFATTADQTEGRSFFELGNGQWDKPELRAILRSILPDNRSLSQFPVTHDFPVIGRRTMTLDARRVDTAVGVPDHILLIVHDATERLEAESALRASEENYRELATTLELRVVERTAELLGANEQLNGFTYSVAHDLRQQVRGINMHASIVLSEAFSALDEASRVHLQRLVHTANDLGSFVDELLAYARLGRLKPRPVKVSLSELVHEVTLELLESNWCSSKTRFIIAPGLEALGDRTMLRVVMQNLIDNACKFSSACEKPIVEFGRDPEGFFVRDNGVGFDMAYVAKLFLPFERLHTAVEYQGKGIGLANVKRIVEKHGGHIWADGVPGEGATFHFTLGLT